MIEQSFCSLSLQDIEKENKPQHASSIFKSAMTNLAYSFKNNCIIQLPFLSRIPLEITEQGEKAYLLGKLYDYNKKTDFQNAFEQVIWFSYRKIPNQCEDVGWGCMIRVIQMMIAQAIARNKPQMHLNDLIDLFRQQKQGPLSLSQICKMGHINNRWSSCPQILMITSSILHELRKQGEIQLGFQIFCDKLQIKQYQQYKSSDFPKMITVHTQAGCSKTIDQKYLFHILQLFRDKHFIGMASGKDTEALYIIGSFQDLAIILDPHYVQKQESFRTFFPKNPQGIKFNQLASGISLSFYVPDLASFQQFVGELLYSHRLAAPYTCFELVVEGQSHWNQVRRKGSDDFQLL